MAVRLPNTELVLPVIVGTVAIHLGKKVGCCLFDANCRGMCSTSMKHTHKDQPCLNSSARYEFLLGDACCSRQSTRRISGQFTSVVQTVKTSAISSQRWGMQQFEQLQLLSKLYKKLCNGWDDGMSRSLWMTSCCWGCNH